MAPIPEYSELVDFNQKSLLGACIVWFCVVGACEVLTPEIVSAAMIAFNPTFWK